MPTCLNPIGQLMLVIIRHPTWPEGGVKLTWILTKAATGQTGMTNYCM